MADRMKPLLKAVTVVGRNVLWSRSNHIGMWWVIVAVTWALVLPGCSGSKSPPVIEQFQLQRNTGFFDDAQSSDLSTSGVVKLDGLPAAVTVELDINGDNTPEATTESSPEDGQFRFPEPTGLPKGEISLWARAVRKISGSGATAETISSAWIALPVRKVLVDWGHMSCAASEIGPLNCQFSVGLPNGVSGRILVDFDKDGTWDHSEPYDPDYRGLVIEQLEKADLLGTPRDDGKRVGRVRIEAEGIPAEESDFEIVIHNVPPDAVIRMMPTASPTVLRLIVETTDIGLDQVTEIRVDWADGKKSVIRGNKADVEHDFGLEVAGLLNPAMISVVDEDGEHVDEYGTWTVIDERAP